jgi:hypothetical protein
MTKEQKREAELAIYGGLPQQNTMQNLTSEEIERMRAIVAQADEENGSPGMPKEFDLNNPPKVPYVHKEFPKMLYKDGRNCVVQNRAEMEGKLAQGWTRKPVADLIPEKEEDFDEETQAEIDELNAKLEKPKDKKRG